MTLRSLTAAVWASQLCDRASAADAGPAGSAADLRVEGSAREDADMSDTPWRGDACSLVDAFRAGERSPVEELEATLAAIERSQLNAFSHLDPERARSAARAADVSLPFGGVPTAIKELDPVAGWPWTEASLVYKDRVATRTSHQSERLFERGGVVPVGQTTASEFGGLNVSISKINGVTHNPWQHGRTVGGSSSGSAAAVAGGLVSLATGGDGGGSIRIPAGYTGLLGMKGTFGRIPRSPHAFMRPNTVVLGNLSRSVRDAARYYDVCAGVHPWDPSSLPSHGRWEAELGTQDLAGLKVAVVPALGGVTLEPGVEDQVRASAKALIADTGMVEVDVRVEPPNLAAQWMMGNLATLLADLGPAWPGCAADMTDEVAAGLRMSQSLYNLKTAAVAEELRVQANEVMGRAFEEVDLIIAATNPGPAFPADATTSSSEESFLDKALANDAAKMFFRGVLFGTRVVTAAAPALPSFLLDQASKRFPDLVNMGALTIISNIYGNPAVSIPAGTVDGLPVGMQVLARHHADAVLFDVALSVERERPWPLVAP
jgi:Asp-tRNA(Asn)/Glu-tRNA(Gln) amidotransferase A subunit family amidase